jgi:hypothetical protein
MSPAETNAKSNSTGPRTPEGKRKASHNALRHGLTGRVVVMPWEDMDAYNAFCKELMDELAPEGAIEKQYAQTFCDTQWRLNRARSYEEGILLLDQMEQRQSINVGHPQANNALMAARAFRDNSKVFSNLSLYEQRLHRAAKEAMRQLEEHQAARKANQTAEAHEEKPVAPAQKAKAANYTGAGEFVFSTPEIALETEPAQPHQMPESTAQEPAPIEDFPDQIAA